MLCQACEQDDHDNCGMQTWCECDCEGYMPDGYYFHDDLDGGRLVKKEPGNELLEPRHPSNPTGDPVPVCDPCGPDGAVGRD